MDSTVCRLAIFCTDEILIGPHSEAHSPVIGLVVGVGTSQRLLDLTIKQQPASSKGPQDAQRLTQYSTTMRCGASIQFYLFFHSPHFIFAPFLLRSGSDMCSFCAPLSPFIFRLSNKGNTREKSRRSHWLNEGEEASWGSSGEFIFRCCFSFGLNVFEQQPNTSSFLCVLDLSPARLSHAVLQRCFFFFFFGLFSDNQRKNEIHLRRQLNKWWSPPPHTMITQNILTSFDVFVALLLPFSALDDVLFHPASPETGIFSISGSLEKFIGSFFLTLSKWSATLRNSPPIFLSNLLSGIHRWNQRDEINYIIACCGSWNLSTMNIN